MDSNALYMVLYVLCVSFQLNTADISHLRLKYLPPMMQHNRYSFTNGNTYINGPKQMTTTSIEKQYLRELPEQIEYDKGAQYDNMGPMMNGIFTMIPMPSVFMQPPPQPPESESEPAAVSALKPFEQPIVPAYTMQYASFSRPSWPAMKYLPPKTSYSEFQPLGQQYNMAPMLYNPLNTQAIYQQKQQVPQHFSSIFNSMPSSMATEMPQMKLEQKHMVEYRAHAVEPQQATGGYQHSTPWLASIVS